MAAVVEITGRVFSPPRLEIAVGGYVTWLNHDNQTHNVTFDDSSLAGGGDMLAGQSFSRIFPSAGSYTYHCAFHPEMTGIVVVKPKG